MPNLFETSDVSYKPELAKNHAKESCWITAEEGLTTTLLTINTCAA
jgi:hypothetical protein